MLFRSIPVDWTVIAGAKNVKVYSDAAMTQPLVALHFGEIPQGEFRVFPFWIYNEGVVPTDVVTTVEGFPEGATLLVFPESVHLAGGEHAEGAISVALAGDAPLEFQAVTVHVSDGIA